MTDEKAPTNGEKKLEVVQDPNVRREQFDEPIKFQVLTDIVNNKIVLQFSKNLSWIAFDPTGAAQFAKHIADSAAVLYLKNKTAEVDPTA